MELMPWEKYWQDTKDFDFMRDDPEEADHPLRVRMGKEAANVGGKVLDMGCGTAIDYPRITGLGLEYYAIEPIPRFIEAAKARYPDINIKQGRVWNIDYPDNFFDVSWMRGVVQHLPPGTYPEALDELWRVTKTLMMVSTNRVWSDGNISHRQKGTNYDNHYNFEEFWGHVRSLKGSVSKSVEGFITDKERVTKGMGVHTVFMVYKKEYWDEHFGEFA